MPDNDLPFEDLSPEEDEELSSEELEVLAAIQRGEVEEPVPNEEYIERFVEHFGYAPKIKEWNAFLFYVLNDFNPIWRDEAIEVEHERP